MVELYIKAINTPGTIPNLQKAWDTFVDEKCSGAKEDALVTYDKLTSQGLSGQLPCDNDTIRLVHNAAFEECEGHFMAEIAGISTDTVEKYMKELKVSHLNKSSAVHKKKLVLKI